MQEYFTESIQHYNFFNIYLFIEFIIIIIIVAAFALIYYLKIILNVVISYKQQKI